MERPIEQSPTPEAMIPMIPESEMKFSYTPSPGPGGQNVNKVETAARVHWSVKDSDVFTDEQKAIIRARAGGLLNSEDQIVIRSFRTRSKEQNKEDVIRKLQELAAKWLTPQKERKTEVPKDVQRAMKSRRFQQKSADQKRRKNRTYRGDE